MSVLIASQEPLGSLGLRVTLEREPDFEVVGEVSEANDIVKSVAGHDPELRSLLTGPREHKPADDALRIMQECCLLALRESAHGCIAKASPPHQIVTARRSVMAGELWAGAGLAQHWREWWQKGSTEEEAEERRLTAREIEIVGLVVDGKSNATIAAELGLKEQTIKNHVARIMTKLRVRNRVELALKAVRDHIA